MICLEVPLDYVYSIYPLLQLKQLTNQPTKQQVQAYILCAQNEQIKSELFFYKVKEIKAITPVDMLI